MSVTRDDRDCANGFENRPAVKSINVEKQHSHSSNIRPDLSLVERKTNAD